MVCRLCTRSISIHALREEGDVCAHGPVSFSPIFLSTPSARRATVNVHMAVIHDGISIHALREEGDMTMYRHKTRQQVFLSTPSARRATPASVGFAVAVSRFLSTPSARRATGLGLLLLRLVGHFYPRPPRGGRLDPQIFGPFDCSISIHALREEGDPIT